MTHTVTWAGDRDAIGAPRSALRRVFAVLLAVLVLVTAIQHVGCSCADGGDAASIAMSGAEPAAPAAPDQDQCVPGHCHCFCHVVTGYAAAAVSKPIQFADAVYARREPQGLWSLSVGPPFEPPCA